MRSNHGISHILSSMISNQTEDYLPLVNFKIKCRISTKQLKLRISIMWDLRKKKTQLNIIHIFGHT